MYKTLLEKLITISKEIEGINRVRFSKDLTFEQNNKLNKKVSDLRNQYKFIQYMLKTR